MYMAKNTTSRQSKAGSNVVLKSSAKKSMFAPSFKLLCTCMYCRPIQCGSDRNSWQFFTRLYARRKLHLQADIISVLQVGCHKFTNRIERSTPINTSAMTHHAPACPSFHLLTVVWCSSVHATASDTSRHVLGNSTALALAKLAPADPLPVLLLSSAPITHKHTVTSRIYVWVASWRAAAKVNVVDITLSWSIVVEVLVALVILVDCRGSTGGTCYPCRLSWKYWRHSIL